MNFYNDNDSYVAEWLGNLIAAGHLPSGSVDARSILEIDPAELGSFRQCHFFSGIGGWPYALQIAGWPEDREVWTGSCPCQPLSSAGQRKGHADERHLWPAFYRLIAECRPATIFGEQVASKDGREWLAGIRADLEDLGYAFGAADLPAACVGAPHIRSRLFWVADASSSGSGRHGGAVPRAEAEGSRERQEPRDLVDELIADGGMGDAPISGRSEQSGWHDRADNGQAPQSGRSGGAKRLGDAIGSRLEERAGERRHDEPERAPPERDGSAVGGLADPDGRYARAMRESPRGQHRQQQKDGGDGYWFDAIWLPCLDGKARRAPAEPALQPLADGFPGSRVGVLRGAGNAIVPQVSAEFVKAFIGIIR